jgi:hypothetical protein
MVEMKSVAVVLFAGVVASACANVECSFNSDCGEHARCEMNRCARDCLEDRDCDEGATCNPNGRCVAPTPADDRPAPQDTPVIEDRGSPGADAGFDAGFDAGADVGFDAGADVGFDAGFDAGTDVGFDAGTDVGFDVGFDVGRDAGLDVGAPDAPVGPVAVGVYAYDPVRPEALRAPVAVAWHPGGGYALILSASDTVFRYDVTARAVSLVGSAGSSVSWRAASFTPGGARALLLARTVSGSTTRGRVFAWDHATSTLTERAAEASTAGTYEALRWSPDGSRAMLLASGPNSITLWPYDAEGTRTGAPAGYGIVPSTGCNDLAWVRDGFGDPALMVVCGTNTGAILSVTGLDSGSPRFTSAATSSQTGNVHRIAARPQGDGAIAIGSSSSKLYRYRDAVWSVGFASPFLAFSFGVSFSSDGARGLAFGGLGRAYEYRYDLYASDAITDVRMPDLAAAPYTQPSNAQLNDMAWRPGCHEGLAVGGANSISGTTAFVAYFRVLNGTRCN